MKMLSPKLEVSDGSLSDRHECSDSVSTNGCQEANGRRKGLISIIKSLKEQQIRKVDTQGLDNQHYQPLGSTPEPPVDVSPAPRLKPTKRRRVDRINTNGNMALATAITPTDFSTNNNNNHVKNERLSPSTPDTPSRSPSVTPSSGTHPDTPPEASAIQALRERTMYSDFMRSIAAKYNAPAAHDYFSPARNGFSPQVDPRLKPPFNLTLPQSAKDDTKSQKPPDFSSLLNNSFAPNLMFQPVFEMTGTQALVAAIRQAKETERLALLKIAKQTRPDTSSPLDLSSAAPPPAKRSRTKAASNLSNHVKRDQSESPNLHEDISGWSIDDVCNFVGGIDICSEYVQNFKDQRIDGAGLPLLTEEHLTSIMGMKLGPALKLKSMLAKKIGPSYSNGCIHCSCSASPPAQETGSPTGNTSDSGGNS